LWAWHEHWRHWETSYRGQYRDTFVCPGGPDDGYVWYYRQWYSGWEDPENYSYFTTRGPFPLYYWYGTTSWWGWPIYRKFYARYWARIPNVTIGQEANILQARISFSPHYNHTWWWGWWRATAHVSFVDVDDYTAPKTFAEYDAEVETSEVELSYWHGWWNYWHKWWGPFNFDVTDLLQERVNSSGWSTGNAIGVHLRLNNFYGCPWWRWRTVFWYNSFTGWKTYWEANYLWFWNHYHNFLFGSDYERDYWFNHHPFYCYKASAKLYVEWEERQKRRWMMVGL
jgi:hypothetical protein